MQENERQSASRRAGAPGSTPRPPGSTRGAARRAAAGAALAAAAALCLAVVVGLPLRAGAAPEPRSALSRPDRAEPIFVVGHVGVTGTLDYDFCRPSYGLSLLFRPAAAAQFLGALYDWNTALVLQGERRSVSVDRRVFSVGVLLRRYVQDMRGNGPGSSPFIGAGLSGAQITYPLGAAAGDSTGVTTGKQTELSPLAEIGYESSLAPGCVFQAKAQWQIWRRGDRNYSGWTLQVGAGIPVPW